MLDRSIEIHNYVDTQGNPTGGIAKGVGVTIHWQNGPLGRDGNRQSPNGAFVETVLYVAMTRLEFYQEASGGRFACWYNKVAINLIRAALEILNQRTIDRESRKVEGTHEA